MSSEFIAQIIGALSKKGLQFEDRGGNVGWVNHNGDQIGTITQDCQGGIELSIHFPKTPVRQILKDLPG